MQELSDENNIINKITSSTNWQNRFLAINSIKMIAKRTSQVVNTEYYTQDIFNQLENFDIEVQKSLTLFGSIETDDFIKTFLEVDRLKAGLELIIARIYLNNGKAAFEKNRYSYEGVRFEIEMSKKAPPSIQETQEWKESVNNLNQAEKLLEEHLNLRKDKLDNYKSY